MYRLMILSFLFLGWGFYELSGGPNFRPAETPIAAPILVTEAELVSIDETRLLIADAVADVAAADTFAPPEIVMRSSMDFTRPAGVDARDGLEELTDVALASRQPLEGVQLPGAAEEAPATLYEVAGTRVNMRGGPGTGHRVIVTLDGGTALEVIGRSGGWAEVRLPNGRTGWMSANLLREI